ncbi:MAG: hypothetical protein KQH79_07425 [Bacteroidetes bacterium]|nr:hypothetical protein [Bacteroidota bacterium]
MKTKIMVKILFIAVLGLLINTASAQNRRAKHHKAHTRTWKRSHRHAPNHRYAKLPKWGKSYASIHKKAHRIAHRGLSYYYRSGIYYKKARNAYVIAKAPIGVRVTTLPRKHHKFMVRGKKYYYYYGTYYVKVDNSNEYETVKPPIGAKVDALPEGYTQFQDNGVNYFEFEGTVYKEVNVENEILYEVIKND